MIGTEFASRIMMHFMQKDYNNVNMRPFVKTYDDVNYTLLHIYGEDTNLTQATGYNRGRFYIIIDPGHDYPDIVDFNDIEEYLLREICEE